MAVQQGIDFEHQVEVDCEPPADLLEAIRDDSDSTYWEESVPDDDLPVEDALLPIEPLAIENAGILTLRPYQNDAVAAVYKSLRESRSTLAVMATGLGKTIVAAEIALLWPESAGRVLFIAHRKELIEQGAEKIGLHIDEACGIEMASVSEARQGPSLDGISKVLVGSVQTLCRLNRLKAYRPEHFGLVVCDEAHHGTAASYKTIFGWFQQNPQCRFLGITATPDRADEVKLGEVFESVAYKMDILDGIEQGWLVPIHQKYVTVEGLDFSACRTTAGDLNDRDLERAMAGANSDETGSDDQPLTEDQIEARKKQERMLHAVADPTIREAAGRPGIVFCVTIDHAEKMAVIFRRYGVTAEAVTQKTDADTRAEHVAAFKSGKLQFLIGVGVFTEGFDAPNAAVISVARPTKSRALYTQMIGRSTRPDLAAIEGKVTAVERVAAIAASGKAHATVLDFVGNSGRHKLISTAEILGDAFPEDLRAAVIAAMRRAGATADMRTELADAQRRKAEMDRLKRLEEAERKEAERIRYLENLRRLQEEQRTRNIKAKANYQAREVDPFGQRAEYQPTGDEFRGGASDKQVKYLVGLGVKYETALGYTSRQAGAVIDKLTSKTGGEFRVWFGKHKGKSLAQAGENWCWWVENQMGDSDLRQRLITNIDLWRMEKKGVVATVSASSTSNSDIPF